MIDAIYNFVLNHIYYRSTSPPGGNQVDGLPPALRIIEQYIICTHFSYIEHVLRIHLVKISLIFIKYEPSTERLKGLAHECVLFCVCVCVCVFLTTNHNTKHNTHRCAPYMARRAVVSRVIRVQRRYVVRIRPMELGGLVHFESVGLVHFR